MLNLKQLGEKISQSQESAGLFIPAGIHENILLDEVKIKETPSGTEVFEVTYKKDNKKCYQTEWLHPSDPIERQESVASRILCLLTPLFPKEKIEQLEAENITEFAKKAVLALSSIKEKVKLRVKFVYNKDKVSTPRYSKFPWIESMDVPASESKIQWLSNIDSLTPETPKV